MGDSDVFVMGIGTGVIFVAILAATFYCGKEEGRKEALKEQQRTVEVAGP